MTISKKHGCTFVV